ncbi:MAG: S53 family peptidase [Bryobacteraceae bacterium]|jgi:subtilase family serine protease
MRRCYLAILAAALPLLGQTVRLAHPTIVIPPQSNALGKPTGIFPAQMVTAYGFSATSNQGQGQIIGIVDAYDDPKIESDLGVFSTQFGLPSCTTANGCFQKIYATGTAPKPNSNWASEISLDVEWSHAIAPQAKIMLVEASGQTTAELYQAVDVAVANGATVVSMSWGFNEYSEEVDSDSHFTVPGVTFVAASGDSGHGVLYPSASPYVVAVGGTELTLNSNGTWKSEVAWSGSGGGASAYEAEPSYQASAQTTGSRSTPDVAYDADPKTGVPIYISEGIYGLLGWVEVGGTSMASPEWAALFAIANSLRAAGDKAPLNQVQYELYTITADYHDIVSGSNGTCGAECTAGPGYDFVTGLGSPMANLVIPALVAAN